MSNGLTSTLTLTEVETAIRDILLTGVSHSRPGMSLTRASLGELNSLRKTLIKEATRASSDGVSFISDFSSAESDANNWGD